eukprot:TRINITY_DN4858_c0_g1_i2.p1 TRINITY_DN4858_c0_g1~~TRINITY_DN4858_c0_g1_i2.p1  ORF type:complete len:449 (-),score=59.64 TRINITY_DN4858_c0_g1_i2:1071-2417(-)
MNLNYILETLFNPPKQEQFTTCGSLASKISEIETKVKSLKTLMSDPNDNGKEGECAIFTKIGKYCEQQVYYEYRRHLVKNISIQRLMQMLFAVQNDKKLYEKFSMKVDGTKNSCAPNSLNFKTEYSRLGDSSKFFRRHCCDSFKQSEGDIVMDGISFTVCDNFPVEVLELGGNHMNETKNGHVVFETWSIFSPQTMTTMTAQSPDPIRVLCERWSLLKALVDKGELPDIVNCGAGKFTSALKNHPLFKGIKLSSSPVGLGFDEYCAESIQIQNSIVMFQGTALSFSDLFENLRLKPEMGNLPIKIQCVDEPMLEFTSLNSPELAQFESLLAPENCMVDDNSKNFFFPAPIVQPTFKSPFHFNGINAPIYEKMINLDENLTEVELLERLLGPYTPTTGGHVDPWFEEALTDSNDNYGMEDMVGNVVDILIKKRRYVCSFTWYCIFWNRI